MRWIRGWPAVAFAVIAFAAVAPCQERAHSTQIELIHGKPFVNVTIDGKGPFRFVVDTGTNAPVIISPELANRLNLPGSGHVNMVDPSGIGEGRVPAVLASSVEVAGFQFRNVKAVEHSLGDDDIECEGLLGFALFRGLLFTLDFTQHELTLASGTLAPDGGHAVLPFHLRNGLPVITIHVGEFTTEALLDSGGRGLSFPNADAGKLHYLSQPANYGSGRSLSTSFALKSARLDGKVLIGDYSMANPYVEFNSAFPFANIGPIPMQRFAITFDQRAGLVRLSSASLEHTVEPTPDPVRLTNAPTVYTSNLKLLPVD
ncbi:MAG TPA: retropepsin-like aspartic protease [Terracidiphilus sp.]|jgi:predicted aspartyl protease|nr:retropepsin-like aspartic protease [Terracidiphilus sp.]